MDGGIPQGERLREVELAARLGTGRSAVREALRQLVQEGLVQHEPHRGSFVRIITADDLVDVYRAREAVETAALETILARDGGTDLTPLREALERLREAAAGGDGTWREMADVDIRFHETLVAAGRQPAAVPHARDARCRVPDAPLPRTRRTRRSRTSTTTSRSSKRSSAAPGKRSRS